MKQRIELSVEPRNTGKSTSRALRNSALVPAVIYGGGLKNANLSVEAKLILKYNTRAYENALFNLKSSDKTVDGKVALVKSVDIHPLTRRPTHVDFIAIDMNKAIRVWVEIQFDGKPLGLAEGGLLNIVNRQVEVECKPADIPENIKVDISHLGLGDALHVSDVKTPAGIKLISGAELTLAVVNEQEEEAAAPVAAPAAAAPAAAAKPAAAKPAAKK